ncbi:MAG: hypothetical protein M1816_006009 [Peltula sp. TS41687]|nr:MAG: hypothetical protein M1816_006009 [Peltula sp. TS41687]
MKTTGQPSLTDSTRKAYTASARFVPQLTSTVLSYLSIQPTDTLLDLGCGSGQLTAQIAAQARSVLGLDSSPSMIRSAQATYGDSHRNCRFEVCDCRSLRQIQQRCRQPGFASAESAFDKVFANASLHWILRDEGTRTGVFAAVRWALRPGGLFVFEMGGHGNVAEVHTALRAALRGRGVPMSAVRDATPWWFSSEQGMRRMLGDAGLEVVRLETEYRPTRLTEDGEGGLSGWVKLFGAGFFELVRDGVEREAVVREVCEVLEDVVGREEEGGVWLGYVRLRGVARKV